MYDLSNFVSFIPYLVETFAAMCCWTGVQEIHLDPVCFVSVHSEHDTHDHQILIITIMILIIIK